MKQRVKDLIEQGDKQFSKRGALESLWQSISENFYPERADFTVKRSMGDEFASGLMSGFPVMARRDLANSLSTMLRPPGDVWFHARTDNEKTNEDGVAKQWLDWSSDILRKEMYRPGSQFVRATKQGDNDFAAFGQCVISVETNQDLSGILYRCWHLRDVAWCENAELVIDVVHRKWKLEARAIKKLFPKTISSQVSSMLDKEPYKEIKCRHIVMPSDQYDYNDKQKRNLPFVSIYIDTENDTILEEKPVLGLDYVIPRWVTVSGNQYAYSPAVVVALPDARMLQQIGLTLLEAGQKAVDPPMIAVGEVIGGGVNTYAGGVTWVDAEYDERSGEALRPMNIDTRGLNWGVAREQACHDMISQAFYLNQIQMPDTRNAKTAYEVQQLVAQYIRQATPLFEPMQTEYNSGICEKSFEVAMRLNKFGSKFDVPPVLRGADLRFQFESPLQQASERAKATAFSAAGQLLKEAMALDPTVRHDIDLDKAFRGALSGSGVPADWIVPEDKAQQAKDQERAQVAQQQATQQKLAQASQVAQVAQQAGEASQSLQAAGVGV